MDGIKEVIPEKYQKVGAIWEEMVEARIQGKPYEREVPVESELLDVRLRGRVDYLINKKHVFECKAGIGGKFNKFVVEGMPKLSHFSQVATYLLILGTDTASILTASFTEEFKLMKTKYFNITLSDSGVMQLDGKDTDHSIQQLLDAIQIHKNKEYNRPLKANKFDGPCKWCKFNTLCLEIDGGLSMEEARMIMRESLNVKE
jgi:hypothetical protein